MGTNIEKLRYIFLGILCVTRYSNSHFQTVTEPKPTNIMYILMDLFPTFCEVAGIELAQHIDGISILPSLLGKQHITDDRFVFWVRREGGN